MFHRAGWVVMNMFVAHSFHLNETCLLNLHWQKSACTENPLTVGFQHINKSVHFRYKTSAILYAQLLIHRTLGFTMPQAIRKTGANPLRFAIITYLNHRLSRTRIRRERTLALSIIR